MMTLTYVKIIDTDTGEVVGYDNTGLEDWQAHFSKSWDSYWLGRTVRFEQISEDEYEAAA